MPIFILSLIAIWLMVGFSWFNWIVGLYLTVLTFVVLYAFAIFYRIHASDYLYNQNKKLQNDATNAQKNFENSIAYWPQGMFAVACAVTSTGTTGWVCNEPACPPCSGGPVPNTKSSGCGKGVCGGATRKEEPEVLDDDIDEINPEPVKPQPVIRKRLVRRRRIN